ncbi:HAD family phosphatase [Cetobacterium sp. 8H]|uniref:Cof-type HAD-IIB family hydrolase n=1 Tax=Cetobacterium sp. 8H TaxID=2759681 RepID=UPI00163C241B|nr:Cof-type HAD-IIB family hydrolase [Cetobacterium sp. 8H]MBC2850045.1 HAD family phosphatase [Cetobacterium sp. 8H]
MYKLIISDLDGTLVDSNKNLSEYTKEVIGKLKEKGIYFIIATGRNYKGAKKVADSLNLNNEIICNNGSTIYDHKGHLIFQRTISSVVAKKIFLEIQNTKSIFFASYGNNTYIQKGKFEKASKFLLSPPENPIEITINNVDSFIFEKIVIINRDNNTLKELSENFNKIEDVNAFISQDYYLDIVHHETSKGAALKFLADLKNIDLKYTLAFGDAFNDYEMLKLAGKGIVMANGFDELKNEFETLELTNDDNGVASYLSTIFNL